MEIDLDDLQISQLSGRIWQGQPREDLVARVSNALREQIKSGELAHGVRLPGEAELARQLSVSRPTLREATRTLSQEGLLDIRHGVGTFVASPPRHVSSALDTMRSMSALIKEFGGEPRVASLAVRRIEADATMAAALGLAEGAPVAEVSRVRLIDDRPLALAYEFIPLVDVEREMTLIEGFDGGSIYRFVSDVLGWPLIYSEMSVTAVSAGKKQAEQLHLNIRAPLLLMREVHFDAKGRRVLYSVNYHNSSVVEFTLVRVGAKS
jgi:GntR family transcriptional regulator